MDQLYTICPVCRSEHAGFGAHPECQSYLDDEPDEPEDDQESEIYR